MIISSVLSSKEKFKVPKNRILEEALKAYFERIKKAEYIHSFKKAALDEEIARIQNTPPTEEAIQRALKQAKALFAYGSESISNQAFWLGFSEMFDHYPWFRSYLDRLAEVTPEEVQRIAQTYLRPQNRILGTYLPTNSSTEVKA